MRAGTDYVGASAGQSTTDSCITGTCDKSDIGWKAYGGLEVNEYISMEVGYVDLGTVDYSAPTGTRETHGVTMQLLGTYALNPSFTLLARGGMNFLKTDVSGAVPAPAAMRKTLTSFGSSGWVHSTTSPNR